MKPTLFRLRRRATTVPTPVQRARSYFARLIWLSLLLSIIGNALHNIPSLAVSLPVQITLSVIPPILLALLIHGLSHLAAAKLGGALYNAAAVAVGALAVGAGIVSFVTLQALALMPYQGAEAVHGGWPESWAWLLPVLLDVPVVVATAVLVAVDRAAMRTAGASTSTDVHQSDDLAPGDADDGADPAPADAPTPADPEPALDDDAGDDAPAPVAHQAVTSGDAPADAPASVVVHAADAPDAGDDKLTRTRDIDVVRPDEGDVHQGETNDPLLMLAHHLVREGRTTASPDVVHMILVRTTAGASSRQVAAEVGEVSYSAVQRIAKAAREVSQSDGASPSLTLVG